MIRVRFGIKTGWPFPNKAVFVARVDAGRWFLVENAVEALIHRLIDAGLSEWASAIICERS